MQLLIRQATPEDGLATARIYAPYVAGTPISFEEIPPAAEEMAGRIRKCLPQYPYLVAEVDGAVVGYAYASPHNARASYRWSVDVAVYLDGQFCRRGIGTHLYSRLLPLLEKQGYVMAHAGITVPNPASVGMHESLGFMRVGIYRSVGFKLGAWREVGWWQRQLPARIPDAPAEPVAWSAMPALAPISVEIDG